MPQEVKVNIDYVCELILDGKTFREMTEILTVSLSTLHDFCSKTEHSARVREALRISADSYADLAEKTLKDLKKGATAAEITQARELSFFYRWKAKTRDPKRYADKVDVTTNNESINKLPDLSGATIEQLQQLRDGSKPNSSPGG